jgi:tetratricopeptide (TPR) repeat protein
MDGVLDRPPCSIAYLAGAGVSIPPPSALPGAPALISALVEALTSDPSLRASIEARTFNAGSAKRFTGDFLRFEAVIGCIKLAIDSGVRILSVYSACTEPNPYHFYLAEQLARGAMVLTTNFDNLIEIACQARSIEYSLVVSNQDLTAFSVEPTSFKNPLIKLHGGYDVLSSHPSGPVDIKATLEQVGRVYLSGGSQPLTTALATVSRSRHLVVMGYSGCDDFDIMPCLLKEDLLPGLTWIDHADQSTELHRKALAQSPDLPPYRLLAARSTETSEVTVIRGSTASILGIDMSCGAGVERYDWTRVFTAWRAEHLGSESHRLLLLGELLVQMERFAEGVEIFESIAIDELSQEQATALYFSLSCLYVYLNDTPRAIRSLSEIAESDHEVEGLSLKGFAYYNLARINTSMGQYTEAGVYLRAALNIFKGAGDAARISDCLHEAGRIYIETGNSEAAVTNLHAAVRLSQVMGDLRGTAIGYSEIARALAREGKLDEGEAYARKAINVSTLDGNQGGLGGAHHVLGYILSKRENWTGAAGEFQLAIEYERSAGASLDLAHSLHSLGDMYISMEKLEEAEQCLEEALRIKREINDKPGIARSQELLEVARHLRALGSG